jgi:hypothetical protein
MTYRDRLAQELAILLPGCHVAEDGVSRIRIHFPEIGVIYLAVSKSGRVVESCDAQGRAPKDLPAGRLVTAQDAAQTAVGGLIRRQWQWSAPEPRHLEQLAALGFADRVPDLARSALARIDRRRAEIALDIAERQKQDADLAVKAEAYRALVAP